MVGRNHMTTLLLAYALVGGFMFAFAIVATTETETSAKPIEFFIAPDGSDDNPGTQERPFATIERAQKAVREVKGKSEVRVFLRGGIYYREKPIVFTADDSGTKDKSIIWAGYKGEKVIISAGRKITGWIRKGTHWEAYLPEVKKGEWYFGQLYIRRKGADFFTRRYRPVKGLLVVAGHSTTVPPKNPHDPTSPIKAWKFFPGDIGQWENMSNVEFVAFHSWSSCRLLPKRVDYENCEIEFTDYPFYRVTRWYGINNPYYAENVKEEFGKPGEWYLDRGRGVLMYTPAPGETLEDTEVVAPVLEQILILKGARNLVFKNLSFMHMAWHIPPSGFADFQSMFKLPANIVCEGCENITFERCTIAHFGAYGLGIGLGCRYITVRGCTFYDGGGGAIKIGALGEDPLNANLGPAFPEDLLPAFITVENCFIRDMGLIHFGVAAIASAGTKFLHIRHNLIDGAPYHGMGLEIGRRDPAVGTVVEYNEIRNVMNLLEDGAAIYGHFQEDKRIKGATIICGNHIYNLRKSHVAAGRKQCGIYPDHGSWGCVVEENVIYDTDGAPLFGTLDPRLAMVRVNAKPEEAHIIRGNVIDIRPGDPGFPIELVKRAGIEPEYADIVRNDLPRVLPQVYNLPLPDTSSYPKDFFEDFERYQPGWAPLELEASPRRRNNYAEVTGEDGCQSKQCLKFVDGPSRFPWTPMVSRDCIGVKVGSVRLSFDFKNSSNAPGRMNVELRDRNEPYRVGPRVRLLSDGIVVAGRENAKVTKIALGQWAHVSIEFTLPGKTFNVAVSQGKMKATKSLSFVHDDFGALEKILFIADGNEPAVMYLDNVKFEVKHSSR